MKQFKKYNRMFNLMKPLLEENLGNHNEITLRRKNKLDSIGLSENERKLAEFLIMSPATIGTRGRIYCVDGCNRSDYDSIRYLKGLGLSSSECLSTLMMTLDKMFPVTNSEFKNVFGGILYCSDIQRIVISCHRGHGGSSTKHVKYYSLFFDENFLKVLNAVKESESV